jgi:hypothetical protein
MPELDTPTAPEDSSSLVDSLMADIADKPQAQPEPSSEPAAKPDATPPSKPVEPSKPTPVAKTPDKPTKPPEAKPSTPAKPEQEFKTPKELRDAYNKTRQEFEEYKKTSEMSQKQIQKERDELKTQKFWTKDDEQRFNDLQQALKDRESKLYTRDYASSPEFKEKYEKRWETTRESAYAKVGGLVVKTEKDGEVSERQATKADFEKVLRAPVQEQFAVARSLFGESAFLVLGEVNALNQIEREGREAIAQKEKSWETEQQEQYRSQEEYHKTFQRAQQEAERSLVEKYPQIFGQEGLDENGVKAYQKGQEFIASLGDTSKMTPQERGYRATLLKTWAAAFPVMNHRLSLKDAEIAELKSKLESLHKSDPGEGGEPSGGNPSTPSGPQNTEDLAKEFANLP